MRLKGWKRIWIVLTILAWLMFGLGMPAYFANNFGRDWDYGYKLRKDFENPACSNYINQPFSSLIGPEYRVDVSNCWFVYTSRQFDVRKYTDIMPYTLEVYERNATSERWDQFWGLFGLLNIVVFGGALLVYLIGWTIAWIRRGFATQG